MDWLKAYPIFEGVLMFVFLLVVWALKKEFVTKKEHDEKHKNINTRLQSVEQTYAKSDDVDKILQKLGELETGLSKDVAHLSETIKRVERPLNLIVEAKINGKG